MYWKLAFASLRRRRFPTAVSAMLIAMSLIPVFLAVGIGHRPAPVHSYVRDPEMTLPAAPEAATFRPLFRRFAQAFLIACAAITFLSRWANVRPRKHEIGVLRSLGAPKIFVIAIVFTEAAAVSIGATLVAILISQVVISGLNSLTTEGPPYTIGFKWLLIASATVVGAAMGGSTIPCALSVQQDVIDMLDWDG